MPARELTGIDRTTALAALCRALIQALNEYDESIATPEVGAESYDPQTAENYRDLLDTIMGGEG